MIKTELMKRYEAETGKKFSHMQKRAVEGDVNCTMSTGYVGWLEAKANISDDAIEAFQELIRNQCDEISALKEKAAAYDRLMSGSVQGIKEWANILGKPVALDDIGRGWWFTSIPKIINGEWDAPVKALIPDLYIGGGISDWKDSLTLPDGWEDTK